MSGIRLGHPVGPMAAGRSLDALVGRTLFGIKKLYDHDGQPWNGKNEFPKFIPSGKPWPYSIDLRTLPWFSSDIASAWAVVERITDVTSGLVHPNTGFPAGTHFAHWFDGARLWAMSSSEAAEAICRAALISVGAAGPAPAGSE